MYVVIIDYGTGNIKSVYNSIKLAGKNIRKLKLKVSASPVDILQADKIILPGQGSFRQCMFNLMSIKELQESLNYFINDKTKPLLGICVGMQLFANVGYEEKKTIGLGWINATVKKINVLKNKLKLPHIGWNNIIFKKKNTIFQNIKNLSHFYFIHSYEFLTTDKECILAEVDYGKKIIAAINKQNLYGTQFHPEKSEKNGVALIKNFLLL
jgi:glutamine amidotransferase